MKRSSVVFGLIGVTLLAACAEREVILPGKREDIRAILANQDTGQDSEAPLDAVSKPTALRLPAQSVNAEWTHRIGSPKYRASNPSLRATPALVWSAEIGAGDGRRNRITADPVISGGRIFTLDAEAKVTATSTEGATLWQSDLTPARDKSSEATGGGLALGEGKLFVSSGFGRLTAMDPTTGAVLWTQNLDATGSGAPTVYGGVVYLVGGDDTAWALEADTGRIRWQLTQAGDISNVLGAAAPAVTDKFALFAYGDGSVQAAFRKGGLRVWATQVSGQRRFKSIAKVSDITGDPVVDGNVVYVGSHSGRLVALNIDDGERIWTAREGAISPVWPAGGAVFVLTDQNELVRLNASDGRRVWGTKLPNFVKYTPRKAAEVYAHYGPILAGGRLVVASNDGLLRFYDPASGALLSTIEVPGGATTAPIVAGGTLYVVGTRGQLHAFR
ncbi:PQQ-like beta-propeller repeat protein [Thalassovita taeanensis]|uniref:Outer membrane protein assembly factor BamB, contains PQQ-like beta-propeller repeat n=1 Tax=Thalassovita taeanensis TaxID=657014 RepID=A0A1H9HUR9_9RHOB|nr:PQQ-like beta-propeller repeat protein [Thalassovita taeanensis]SEQ66028.1 Outer membrane protein assembly factor BamB, contains PQQ-like beta-propeller repeat [Thalassovita taeanensis]